VDGQAFSQSTSKSGHYNNPILEKCAVLAVSRYSRALSSMGCHSSTIRNGWSPNWRPPAAQAEARALARASVARCKRALPHRSGFCLVLPWAEKRDWRTSNFGPSQDPLFLLKFSRCGGESGVISANIDVECRARPKILLLVAAGGIRCCSGYWL